MRLVEQCSTNLNSLKQEKIMTNLTKIEREILLEVEAELLADIEMLEEHYAILRDLNNKKNLHKNDLPTDILKVFNRK